MSATTIRVGATNDYFQAFADFLDGDAAMVRRSEITISENADGPALLLTLPDERTIRWPLADIRRVPDQADPDSMVLALKGDPISRLIVTDPASRDLLSARCPNLHKRPPVKGRGKLFAWSLGALASVALIIFVLVPIMADQLAEFLPPKGEQALGETTFKQIRSAMSENDLVPVELCENPEGLAALAQMRSRLEQDLDIPYDLNVHVLNHKMVNAFALPGGQIVIFRGLIDSAETPDEVAAVFAHEIGHVVNRDPTRGALRTAGSIGVLGLIFGDFAGGTAVLFMVERLIEASYSQEAEAGADTFAHATLSAQGIPPSALGTFFERLRDKHGDQEGIVAHLAAHPALSDRIAAAKAAGDQVDGPIRPSLGEQAWQDLRAICR